MRTAIPRSRRTRLRGPLFVAVALAAVVCVYPQAQGRSFIWKATAKQGGTVYLVGSVHVLTEKYYPLKPVLNTAFMRSDLLVEEVDMAEMMAPESQMQLLTRGMLPVSQSLDKVLSADTYQATSRKVAD